MHRELVYIPPMVEQTKGDGRPDAGGVEDPGPNTERRATTDPGLDELGPSQADIDAWAQREQARRRAWLEGPSEEERVEWAERERARRRAEAGFEERAAEMARRGRRYSREAQLATEGALSLMMRFSRHAFDDLVRAGRDWEDDTSRMRQGRRIRLDDDDD
jgi:hypothetical protein